MRAYEYNHWDIMEHKEGLLFFSQCLEEMLFHYGHDSLKVPALNFHYLCIEIANTIDDIDNNILDKGNIIPLFEELKDSYNKDPIISSIHGKDFLKLFYSKNSKGDYIGDYKELYDKNTNDHSINKLKKIVLYLIDDMESENKYYTKIKINIEKLIKGTIYGYKEKRLLYNLCCSLLTELINRSYSPEYIYSVVNDIFYNPQKKVIDASQAINSFWDCFDFKKHDYEVLLPLNEIEIKKILSQFRNIQIINNDKKLFNNICKWIINVRIDALDPESARSKAMTLINFFMSLMQFCNHKSNSYSSDKARVKNIANDYVYSLKEPIPPIKRGTNLNNTDANEKIASMVNNFTPIIRKMINVIELHSSAVESNDIDNQILNLWTIIEILIDIERKNSCSKINQICNIITSIMNSNYILSLIEQLILDIKHCLRFEFDNIITRISNGNNESEKMLALIILPKYKMIKEELKEKLVKYPLLQYRLDRYTYELSSNNNILELLNRHQKRLEWHIMRIYRNRNMIVHDGTYYPYINMIVQNLHYYVDSLIETINYYLGIGYNSLETIYVAIHNREYKYQSYLSEKERALSDINEENELLKILLTSNYIIN